MKLTIIGLPIGNIEDISMRAIKRLQTTRFIVCEDTRMFGNFWSKLLNNGVVTERFSGKLKYVNDFNEHRVLTRLLDEMDGLEEAVLVSDAGMPLISDPGYKLVHEGISRGWDISVIPGPTAESAALAVSGLPTDKYMFLGFLPKKGGKRLETLKNVKAMNEIQKFSVVIYESTLRLKKILPEIIGVFGPDTRTCLAVDLTKVSEKILRGTLSDIVELIKVKNIKGEATLILSL